MSWKDWLYISKNDKAAIVGLACLIMVLLIVFLILDSRKKDDLSKLELNESADYLQWRSQLTEAKEIEQKASFEEYKKNLPYTYQPKISAGETVDLNMADTTQLKTIPGIGSGFANRIISYRERLGGFVNMEQLNEVWGLDTYLYSQIIPYLTITSLHKPLRINTDSFEELIKHPYLNYKQVLAIVDIRERKGTIRSLKRLQLLEEFSRKDLEKLSLYASFEE